MKNVVQYIWRSPLCAVWGEHEPTPDTFENILVFAYGGTVMSLYLLLLKLNSLIHLLLR
jgi:hypothetical protein